MTKPSDPRRIVFAFIRILVTVRVVRFSVREFGQVEHTHQSMFLRDFQKCGAVDRRSDRVCERCTVAKLVISRNNNVFCMFVQSSQGPEKHTNTYEYFPETGFGVLPAVPGRRAASHD